ncbi:MAG: hypothetical protein RMM29_07345 [Planctomycetota bacterium]|nr:hypothetical protein [Planctomycetota bacterium]MDW8373446.1 hypothetical protein [Planctomycetota bacterium]
MRVAIKATEEAIIRLLKAGHPLPGEVVDRKEETRLPVFQSVEAVPVKHYGFEGTGRIVVARGRRDVWFVDIKRKDGKLTLKEGESFLDMRDKLQQRYPGQKVTGWLVTTADIDPQARTAIAEKQCFATACAAKR